MINTTRKKRVSLRGGARPILKETSPAPKERVGALSAALVSEVIDIRHANNVTQTQLDKASGVRQGVITQIECGESDPKLSTLIKLLLPFGKTLAVVSLRTEHIE